MALDFISPSVRAAGSDLTIAVSPLGLIELADDAYAASGELLTNVREREYILRSEPIAALKADR